MTLRDQWMDRAEALLRQIRAEQGEQILRAARLLAECLASGGALHYYDSGHCTGELLNRAGGLFAINQIQLNLSATHPLPPRHRGKPKEALAPEEEWQLEREALKLLCAQLNWQPGDALLDCSVSGARTVPVGLALEARRRGIKVVAITSYAYSSAVPARNPWGKKLYEVADVAIDNCVPIGDASLPVAGLETPICPLSGLAFVYISWALVAALVEELLARGVMPTVFRSVNLADGPEFNERARQRYEELGI
jgi:uncharacterized phosphosugar-binding protein